MIRLERHNATAQLDPCPGRATVSEYPSGAWLSACRPQLSLQGRARSKLLKVKWAGKKKEAHNLGGGRGVIKALSHTSWGFGCTCWRVRRTVISACVPSRGAGPRCITTLF